ncbi:MAG: MmgE/PrpD family protein, partial [Alphaproteobacteria bacterium]|nr:MmgE/PrpD family protein [Alphaproteobacteria bacterium]
HRPGTVALWRKVETWFDADWEARYHDPDPKKKAFGGRVEITLQDGRVLVDEIAVADAHPAGARPFVRENYIGKFETLAAYAVGDEERRRFVETAGCVADLGPGALLGLTPVADRLNLLAVPDGRGIFDA